MAFMASLQDFSTINAYVSRIEDGLKKAPQDAFYYFVLGIILGLQDDEIEDAITDNNYLKKKGSLGGHDRGIDAIYIDNSDVKPTVHFFNCKYITQFDKISGHFPSSEIDKIVNFLNALITKDDALGSTVNPVLYSKVREIWEIFRNVNPNFEIHLCANLYHGLIPDEKERFEREISVHSNFVIHYHLIDEYVSLLTRKGKKVVNAKFKGIDRNNFEKSDGDIRALIVNVDARDLVRIVLDNEEIRNRADIDDYEELKQFNILEDAFEDNVRVYLRQRSRVNRNIKNTVLSNDNHRFFYFNNGITITCDKFTYPKTQRGPLIELENLQVVNGSQTIHTLYEAFLENSKQLEYVDLLCRIYETKSEELSTNIAEYTNSQNPVISRDIRSIDYVQQKLEAEFLAKDLYYERKKNQYFGQPRNSRIDAEKLGQVLFAFYNKMPAEAKNKKRLIFAEKYEEIFNDSINADKALLAYRLFERIEDAKNERKSELLSLPVNEFEEESFILYASYYILYIIGELAQQESIDVKFDELPKIWALYSKAVGIVRSLVQAEKQFLSGHKDSYTHASYFVSNKPKKDFEEELFSSKIASL
jgi:predicted transcriptional regulator